MAVINPRNRLLIFRLTQEEYESLQSASSGNGARSLSEFARTKLLGSLQTPRLDAQLSDLRNSVARITELLEKQ